MWWSYSSLSCCWCCSFLGPLPPKLLIRHTTTKIDMRTDLLTGAYIYTYIRLAPTIDFGHTKTSLYEFPWQALYENRSHKSNQPPQQHKCGDALLSCLLERDGSGMTGMTCPKVMSHLKRWAPNHIEAPQCGANIHIRLSSSWLSDDGNFHL